jgi:hypothetical protein
LPVANNLHFYLAANPAAAKAKNGKKTWNM